MSDKPKWFRTISPNGQVPVLITENDIALFESNAMGEYIDKIFPKLEEKLSPEQRALDRAWSYLAAKNYLLQCGAQHSPDNQT